MARRSWRRAWRNWWTAPAPADIDVRVGVRDYAIATEQAVRLWALSAELTGVDAVTADAAGIMAVEPISDVWRCWRGHAGLHARGDHFRSTKGHPAVTTSPHGRLTRTLLTVGAMTALALGAAPSASAAATTAPTQPAPTITAVDFTGIVALSNCSGSVVRTPNSQPGDPALVMSNGHCVRLLAAGEVLQNQASTRTFTLLNAGGTSLGTLRANRLLYATMTNTDVSIYRLTITYAQLQQQFRSRALDLSTVHPTAGTAITVVSGFHRAMYPCNIDGFAFRLREDRWTWQDSVRYTAACHTIPGTSGSPVLDTATGQVLAINNTLNEDAQRCTLDNPCEVDQAGNITIRPDIGYAQQTFYIAACITTLSRIDLTRPGCQLPG